MENITEFEKFIQRIQLTPRKTAELNNLIFFNWDEREARNFFPENIIQLISKVQNNDFLLNKIYDCLKVSNIQE